MKTQRDGDRDCSAEHAVLLAELVNVEETSEGLQKTDVISGVSKDNSVPSFFVIKPQLTKTKPGQQ